MNFINTAQTPSAFFEAQLIPSNSSVDPSGDLVAVSGDSFDANSRIDEGSFSLFIYNRVDGIFSHLTPDGVANLRNFNFSGFDQGDVLYQSASGEQIRGTLTSIEAVTAPEPGMLAIFAMLGCAAIVDKRHRKSVIARC